MNKLFCRTYQLILRYASYLLPWRRPQALDNLESLVLLLKEKGILTPLLVTDKGLTDLGLHTGLLQALEDAGIRCVIYDKTTSNPSIDNIEEALALFHENSCTGIIALGGGSPMDCAKGVGARAVRPNKSISQLRGLLKVLTKIPLLIAIPTTAGSGSETTLAAVITDSRTREKYTLNDPALIPHYTLLDPQLTVGLPPFLTACTGMDALCHAVEAYIGRSNTRQTRQDALKAAGLIFQNLFTAFEDGTNITARKNMQTASFLAGAAFTRAYVGNIHAVAHTLGGQYGTPHGLANAVLMPYVLEMYGEKVYTALSDMAQAAGLKYDTAKNSDGAAVFIAAIREMNARMGIPDKLADLQAEDIPMLAGRALREANPLYPVPVVFGRGAMERVYGLVLNYDNDSISERDQKLSWIKEFSYAIKKSSDEKENFTFNYP